LVDHLSMDGRRTQLCVADTLYLVRLLLVVVYC
jgi:hypothetical protein